jgi:hypothetical protein
VKLVFPIEKYPTVEVEENAEDLGAQKAARGITMVLNPGCAICVQLP